jgi:hypothetical protein
MQANLFEVPLDSADRNQRAGRVAFKAINAGKRITRRHYALTLS